MMFDLSNLTASMAGLFSGNAAADAIGSAAPGLQDMMQHAGLDPSVLAGLTPSAATDLLADYGIDPSALMDGQLDQVLAQFGVDAQVTEGLAGLWSGDPAGGNE